MAITYLFDTNIVIYYLQQQLTTSAEKAIDEILLKSGPSISSITEIELLCWKTANEKDLDILKSFIADSTVFELEQSIKDKTVEVRKKYAIKLPDAIIAATALVNNLSLVTRNSKDFMNISELKLVNPFDV